MPADMGSVAASRTPENRPKLVEPERTNNGARHFRSGRHLGSKMARERAEVLENLDHEVDQLKFASAARPGARQDFVGENGTLIATKEFGGVVEFIAQTT
ncbi:hypothetical protein [Rhodovulum marinum]|uniref:Uncharacterized protein n=1 Tax=Rhodovulum marinum TaxID=320662 RepID=A0A4R2Q5D0_9RHOB|nr:hypothetical protein [Rhodovulum marinum]TCP41901.1 hypothetical protein EV662_104245 [Rhodovulum marinum]